MKKLDPRKMHPMMRWSINGIENYGELFDPSSPYANHLNSVTVTLIHYMSAFGVPRLTDALVNDAWFRVAAFEAAFGAMISCDDVPVFLTRQDIVRHVGLWVETLKEQSLQDYMYELIPRIRAEHLAQTDSETPAFRANSFRTALDRILRKGY